MLRYKFLSRVATAQSKIALCLSVVKIAIFQRQKAFEGIEEKLHEKAQGHGVQRKVLPEME